MLIAIFSKMKKTETTGNSVLSLTDLGYNTDTETYRKHKQLTEFEVGRVITEHKERYTVRTSDGMLEAEVLGNLRYTAESRLDFPAVGDWVALSRYDDNKAFIHHVYERSSILLRKSVGTHAEQQVIATNIDTAFVVQAVNRDFNINRIERYLTISHEANITPVIILTKIDLIQEDELNALLQQVSARIKGVDIIPISNLSKQGLDTLKNSILPGKTYCMLGSSGVGKSSLINSLLGTEKMVTKTIGEGTDRGRHATTHRELVVLPEGGIFIDTPGMRELGVTDVSAGLEQTFELISELAESCRFSDCTHTHEKGCAVLDAVKNEEILEEYYENYLKLNREKEHYASTVQEKRRRGKEFSKQVKTVKQLKNWGR